MSSCFLIVPIYIESLYIEGKSGYLSVESMANFRNLPYCDRNHNSTPELQKENPNASGLDILSGSPYISENIVSQPFQNRNLLLSPGIHLHWQLPKALRTGEHKEEGLSFPTVPNRWLVIRRRGTTIEAQWIVESDYLWPIIPDTDKIENTPKSVCVPYPANPQQGQYQPFRYLGRKLSLAHWLQDTANHEYWSKSLTAIGYGEPAFAAFYPNCYSVFGCHDNAPGDLNSHLSYEVIGWHSEIKFDYIQVLISEYSSETKLSLKEFIQDRIKWEIDKNVAEIPISLQTIYYGCLEFQPENDPPTKENQPELDSVILANSGTEAVSTYIAHKIAENNENLSKSDIENQLEAIQLLKSLEEEQDDLNNKLREARHEKEFISHSSGIVWTIEKIDSKHKNFLESENLEKILSELPEEIGDTLKNLNHLQENYNIIQHELESQRQQIFADWYKYLICLYPPLDDLDRYPRPELVQYFINAEIELLQHKQDEANNIKTNLEHCFKSLNNYLDQLNQSLKVTPEQKSNQKSNAKPPEYQLKSLPAPRYWQPNEPVVMVVFKSEKEKTTELKETPSEKLLNCFILELEDKKTGKALFNENLVTQLRETIKKQPNLTNQFIRVWRSQPWQPFLLEWEVQITGVREQNTYLNNFLEQYYKAHENDIDFQLKDDYLTSSLEGQKDVYTGRSFLSDYAAVQHQEQIEVFFMRTNLFQKFCKENNIVVNPGCLKQNLEQFKDVINNNSNSDNSSIQNPQKQFFRQLLEIYERFNHLQCLSQCLNGFNQALLGRKQTLQLAIDDPIGFEKDQPFVNLVRDAVQNSITSAPQPLNFFNPIRSGSLKISRLRLVDTFGCVRDLNWEKTLTPEYLKASKDNAANLPPRLVQPARLHFRWLSGNHQHTQEEAGSHPNLNPICGWLLPDRLDGTLEVYNTEGQSLGELEIKKAGLERWRPAPGSKFAIQSVDHIPNPHLKRVVSYLNNSDDEFLEDFVQSLSQACEQIDPTTTTSNSALALIMGQPIAVTRISLNLQIQGSPSINQDWAIFKRDIQRFQNNSTELFQRETNNFPNVLFPIYLGNNQRLSDGLVGYWQEIHHQEEIVLSPEVYIPISSSSDENKQDSKIIKQQKPWYQTIQSDPLFFTALIDPRGRIQARSKILPNKSISMPTEHYVNTLNNLSITFLAAPILSGNKISIPVADVTDYSWSWIEQVEQDESKQWVETFEIGQIQRDCFIQHFNSIIQNNSGEEIWEYLCQKEVGWLKADNDGIKYWIVPQPKRAIKQLKEPYRLIQSKIDILLNTLADKVRPTTVEATFLPQEIHEGWLKLNPVSSH